MKEQIEYDIRTIHDNIEQIIIDNKTSDYPYSTKVMNKIKEALPILKKAEIYTQRIDWLISGDDSEESFLERLEEELIKV